MTGDFKLRRDACGRLVCRTEDGREHVDVVAARAFPVTAARQAIALLDCDGHEIVWIPCLDELAESTRHLVEEALASREFMPEISRVCSVTGYATPCTWQVETDRGPTILVLNAEEDIRRLSASMLLIVDRRGIQFLIRNLPTLDATSRKILDHFL